MGFNQSINNGVGLIIFAVCASGLILYPFIGSMIQSRNNKKGGTRHKRFIKNKTMRK